MQRNLLSYLMKEAGVFIVTAFACYIIYTFIFPLFVPVGVALGKIVI